MNWPLVAINECVSKIDTWNPIQQEKEIIFRYIDLSSIDKDNKLLIPESVVDTVSSDAPSRARQLVKTGDILVSTVRPNLNGVAEVLEQYHGATASTGYCVLRPNIDTINRKYLFFWLTQDGFVSQMMKLATGANYPAVSDKIVKNSLIPIPPLREQKRIATTLDKADTIRRKRQQAIELADQFLRSVFLEMFGDSIANPKGWKKIKLKELCSIVRGGSPRPIKDYLNGSIPWIKIGDATKGDNIYIHSTKEKITEEGLHKTRLLQPGALVFANCGVSLGFARILNISGCIHDGWLAFDINDENILNKIFLLKALNQITNYFRNTAPDGTQPNLNTEIMNNFKLILPPIEKQKQFEAIVHKSNSTKVIYEELHQQADNLFNSLTQKAFKGELS